MSKAPALVSIEFDRREPIYRFGDPLTADVALVARRPLDATELRVGLGYAFERKGPPDRLVHEISVAVPPLSPGEYFETSVSFVLPAGLPSYSGISFELNWAVYALFDKSFRKSNAQHRADLTLLPGSTDVPELAQPLCSELVPLVSAEGQVRYRRFSNPKQEALVRYGPLLGAVGFAIAGLGMLGILSAEVIGVFSGPEQVLVNGESVTVDPWQPNLNPTVRVLVQSFGLGLLALFSFIPCWFGYKFAKTAWREQLHPAWVMRRLGELDLEPLAPTEDGASSVGGLRLCSRQELTLETLELKLVQEEVVVRSGRRRENRSVAPQVLGEWSVAREEQLALRAGQSVTLPLEVVVPKALPGSWQLAAQNGDYEVHHRWVLQAWIQPVGEAPVLKTWVVERRPSTDYQPKVSEASQ